MSQLFCILPPELQTIVLGYIDKSLLDVMFDLEHLVQGSHCTEPFLHCRQRALVAKHTQGPLLLSNMSMLSSISSEEIHYFMRNNIKVVPRTLVLSMFLEKSDTSPSDLHRYISYFTGIQRVELHLHATSHAGLPYKVQNAMVYVSSTGLQVDCLSVRHICSACSETSHSKLCFSVPGTSTFIHGGANFGANSERSSGVSGAYSRAGSRTTSDFSPSSNSYTDYTHYPAPGDTSNGNYGSSPKQNSHSVGAAVGALLDTSPQFKLSQVRLNLFSSHDLPRLVKCHGQYLYSLNLAYSHMTEENLGCLDLPKSLRHLDLSNNQLHVLSNNTLPLSELPCLESLNLSNNDIMRILNFTPEATGSLRRLDLSGNLLQNYSALFQSAIFASLEELDLSRNLLDTWSEIPSSVARVTLTGNFFPASVKRGYSE